MEFNYKIILASNSPRRKELLSGLDLDYDIVVLPGIDESYPQDIKKEEVALYIAEKKAKAYKSLLTENSLLITADTVVVLGEKVLGKPIDELDAKDMLHQLSGKTHQVITGVCLTTKGKQKTFSVISDVRFSNLDDSEIEYYVSKYKPLDKAGAYGIQEWIGYVGVEYIGGSYFNVMGLPIQRLYQELKKF
ncbi:septum formation protein [Dysgonomonas alginatilytica]|uniref:dTTP/UTP pyrophosphatase n=1 Tax=Dysgonomonas alginatilytica TaxID=1605892 RepID=A0A2V3PJE2_9BACT|nr:Maf-like protein [Dysgonomonas alginatilytica]PXV60925.1 septum formation protein [Dysgonomonas alginatilytica]